ncbi:hypothetical protein L873DRAFT_1006429 [Choiromyces venosus 120613-1]|uniref:Uncharacterized protein n=1 Tax=Choiromyces venosus 120613-1 TaxID=1336337 RepID=A0A3N4JN39_9PEZI|nr:hypothetical protein L873DRAFT_1006429 [Choiromyces venosus 120613-1]
MLTTSLTRPIRNKELSGICHKRRYHYPPMIENGGVSVLAIPQLPFAGPIISVGGRGTHE